MAYLEALAERIKTARTNCNLSQKDLAKKIDVTPAMVCAYESGQRMPSLIALAKISATLHVTTDYLLGLESPSEQSVSLSGLSDKEAEAIKGLVASLKNESH